MRWLYPWATEQWMWVLLFLLAYGFFGLRVWRTARLLQQPSRTWLYKLMLRTLIALLLMVALLGPVLHTEKHEIQVQSKDIFFCVDVSASMDAIDVFPSRIEKIKVELKRMIEALAGNRMGLIIFSSEAFIQCPLTHDISALGLFVDAIKTDLVSRSGTNFASALRMAQEKLEKAEKEHRRSTAQVLLFISDGEDFGKETQQAIYKLRSTDIHFFTLGIGTEKGGKIPALRGFRRDRQGKVIHTRLTRNQLQKMGDKYFEINAQNNQSPQLIAELQKIKGTLQVEKAEIGRANMYRYFLFVAVFLCILDMLWATRLFRV